MRYSWIQIYKYFFLIELTSKEIIKIQARVAEKERIVETLIDTSISILNEMATAVEEMTSKSDIQHIYDSIDDYIRENRELKNLPLQNMFKNLEEKRKVHAEKQKAKQRKILENFHKFCVRMLEQYHALVECSKSSIVLLVACASKPGYVQYEKDLANGQIGEQLMGLFFFPPLLGSFDLKEDDIEITLNGRLLTQRHGKMNICQAFVSYDVHCTNILVIILFKGILYFLILRTLELAVCIVNV